jgi:hypothetical protein
MKYLAAFVLFTMATIVRAQQDPEKDILETIITEYYKNERPVIKGRESQHLFVYCEQVPNNEELLETINQLTTDRETIKYLRKQINPGSSATSLVPLLESVIANHQDLAKKVNRCLSLEEYHEKQKKSGLNTHRLMIISKPILYPDKKKALLKLVFYRTIEHNKGSVLLMEHSNNKWIIKEHLNPWET